MLYQKIDAPPHLKRCGLIGARFLDARRAPRPKGRGFSKHVDMTMLLWKEMN